MAAKKDEERSILRKVYPEVTHPQVKDRDPPDFWIWPSGGDRPFGVEVTRLFPSGPMARLLEIPGYSAEIFLKQQYRHKDDATALRISDLTFTPPDQKRITVQAVGQQLPDHERHLELLSDLVRRKAARLHLYQAGVTHTNLVVSDRIDVLWRVAPESASAYYLRAPVRRAVLETGFREIYLIATVGDKREMYLPMKFTAMISELAIFNSALDEYRPGVNPTMEGCLRFYVAFARRRGLDVKLLPRPNAPTHVLLGNCSAGSDSIIRYDDHSLPTGCPPEPDFAADLLDQNFADFLEEFGQSRFVPINFWREVASTEKSD